MVIIFALILVISVIGLVLTARASDLIVMGRTKEAWILIGIDVALVILIIALFGLVI